MNRNENEAESFAGNFVAFGEEALFFEVPLGEAGYLRERLNPQPGEMLYLHLADLLIALNALIPEHLSMVLDYGCGGFAVSAVISPLFEDHAYEAAWQSTEAKARTCWKLAAEMTCLIGRSRSRS